MLRLDLALYAAEVARSFSFGVLDQGFFAERDSVSKVLEFRLYCDTFHFVTILEILVVAKNE